MRQGEVERARAIYERYVACAFTQQAYLRFAKWEDRQGQFALSRRVYERAIEDLPEDQKDEDLYISFAKFEEKCHEVIGLLFAYLHAKLIAVALARSTNAREQFLSLGWIKSRKSSRKPSTRSSLLLRKSTETARELKTLFSINAASSMRMPLRFVGSAPLPHLGLSRCRAGELPQLRCLV